MTIIARGLIAALAILAALSALAPARADEDIPAYKVLACEKDCPGHTEAKLLFEDRPFFDFGWNLSAFIEAMVDIDFTISADGSVKSAAVESLIGPQRLADNALYSVLHRRYAPATEDGKPVEENQRVRFVYRVRGGYRVARPWVVLAYGRAIDLAKDGQSGQAMQQLQVIGSDPELNFFERAMTAMAQATLYAKAGDYVSARDAIRIATIGEGSYLDQHAVEEALRLRIKLEAMNGDFAESFAWFEILKAKSLAKLDDPQAKLIADLHATIAAPEPLAMPARIPSGGQPAFWQHTLLRRSFEFHQVVGKLDHFEMHCDRHSILSPISAKANWAVPASWSGCYINVFGAPGSTFQFSELQPA